MIFGVEARYRARARSSVANPDFIYESPGRLIEFLLIELLGCPRSDLFK